jgi:hypothetical protein
VPNAPEAWCAHIGSKSAHQYSQRRHRKHPAFPRANGFTVYSALFPGTTALLTRHPRDALASCELDACFGAPEPHGFTVRNRKALVSRSVAATASHPTFVTIAKRPSWRDGMAGVNHEFPKNGSVIFFVPRLDRNPQPLPVGQITWSPLSEKWLCAALLSLLPRAKRVVGRVREAPGGAYLPEQDRQMNSRRRPHPTGLSAGHPPRALLPLAREGKRGVCRAS